MKVNSLRSTIVACSTSNPNDRAPRLNHDIGRASGRRGRFRVADEPPATDEGRRDDGESGQELDTWLLGIRSESAYERGHISEAIEFAERLQDPYHQRLAASMRRILQDGECILH